jgi:hypothetical protein
MIIRTHSDDERSGYSGIWVMVSLPVILLLIAMSLNLQMSAVVKIGLQNAADSAALAGVGALVDDRILLNDPSKLKDIVADARIRAQLYAAEHRAGGVAVRLDPIRATDSASYLYRDMIFGKVNNTYDRNIVNTEKAADEATSVSSYDVNAVHILARRTLEHGDPVVLYWGTFLGAPTEDVHAIATAVVDRDVIGFRALPPQRIPMVPFAIQSDTSGTPDPDSWEAQRGSGLIVTLPNITLRIPAAADLSTANNAYPIKLGPTTYTLSTNVTSQTQNGISFDDLGAVGTNFPEAKLQLDPTTGTKDVERFLNVGNATDQANLLVALNAMVGKKRIWPLYSAAAGANLTISNFVAATIQSVSQDGITGSILVILKPSMFSTPTALTDPERFGTRGSKLPNPYLARVRLTN